MSNNMVDEQTFEAAATLVALLLLLRHQGLEHMPQMHRSLEAYCATLVPPPPTRDF